MCVVFLMCCLLAPFFECFVVLCCVFFLNFDMWVDSSLCFFCRFAVVVGVCCVVCAFGYVFGL